MCAQPSAPENKHALPLLTRRLLTRLQQLVGTSTPMVVQAALELAPVMGRSRPRRFRALNDIAASMVHELIHLDKVIVRNIREGSKEVRKGTAVGAAGC